MFELKKKDSKVGGSVVEWFIALVISPKGPQFE
jgi:hypothetical protein